MSEPRPGPHGRLLARCAGAAAHRARAVCALALLATGAAAWYALEHLRIETDRDRMLSAELPFRRSYDRLRRDFPRAFADTLVVVVDADTAERASAVSEQLAALLAREPELFGRVSLPLGEPFLVRHALLYLELGELTALSERIVAAQPFLGTLARDPSLAALARLLTRALAAERDGDALDVSRFLVPLRAGIAAALADEPFELSWEELVVERGASAAERRRFVVAEPRLDYQSLFPGAPAIDALRRAARDAGLDALPGVRLRLTGNVVMNDEELESVSRGAGRIAALSFALVGLALLVGLRSAWLVGATLATLVCGLVASAAFAALAVGHLNLVSVAFAALYIGLGVDSGIHYCLRYQELVDAGRARLEALEQSAADVGRSLVACALTTALSFYAFVPTAYSGVSELGLIAGTGMLFSLVAALTLLPALLALAPARAARARPSAPDAHGLIAALRALPVRHRRAVRVAALALALASLASLARVRFDDNPLALTDPNSESVQTFIELLRTSATPPLSLSVPAADAEAARAIAARLRALDVVRGVVTLDALVPSDQDEKLALLDELALLVGPALSPGARERVPALEETLAALRALAAELVSSGASESSALAADVERLVAGAGADANGAERLARLERGLFVHLPRTLERLSAALGAERVGAADVPAALRERYVAQSGAWRVEVLPREDLSETPALRRFVAAVSELAPEATDRPRVMVEAGAAVVGAFRQALALAFVVTVLVLLALLRSARDCLLVLVPLALAGALTAAATVLFGISFNFANVIALPLLLGLGVDSGIHMVQRARSAGGDPLVGSTARAIAFSALTTLASFGNLSLSAHRGTASLGQLLAIGTLLTLLATLVVLPALLGERDAR